MTEPRWDLIHDAVITDDESGTEGCPNDADFDEGRGCHCADHLDSQNWLDEQDALGSDCA